MQVNTGIYLFLLYLVNGLCFFDVFLRLSHKESRTFFKIPMQSGSRAVFHLRSTTLQLNPTATPKVAHRSSWVDSLITFQRSRWFIGEDPALVSPSG